MAKDNAPAEMPDKEIDDIITFVESIDCIFCDSQEDAKNRNVLRTLEEIRDTDSEIRAWGNQLFDELKDSQKELATFKDNVSDLEDEIKKLKDTVSDYDREIQNLQKERENLEDDIKRLENTIENLENNA